MQSGKHENLDVWMRQQSAPLNTDNQYKY